MWGRNWLILILPTLTALAGFGMSDVLLSLKNVPKLLPLHSLHRRSRTYNHHTFPRGTTPRMVRPSRDGRIRPAPLHERDGDRAHPARHLARDPPRARRRRTRQATRMLQSWAADAGVSSYRVARRGRLRNRTGCSISMISGMCRPMSQIMPRTWRSGNS